MTPIWGGRVWGCFVVRAGRLRLIVKMPFPKGGAGLCMVAELARFVYGQAPQLSTCRIGRILLDCYVSFTGHPLWECQLRVSSPKHPLWNASLAACLSSALFPSTRFGMSAFPVRYQHCLGRSKLLESKRSCFHMVEGARSRYSGLYSSRADVPRTTRRTGRTSRSRRTRLGADGGRPDGS